MTQSERETIIKTAEAWFIYCDIAEEPAEELTVEEFKYAKYAELVKLYPNLITEFDNEVYAKIAAVGKKLEKIIEETEGEE